MHSPSKPSDIVPKGVRAAIEESLSLLKEANHTGCSLQEAASRQGLPSLLEQCNQWCDQVRQTEPEPIRTIHHFACTGGTLITKCIASMPNTQVLSEVDPLSAQAHASSEMFCPTDLIRLLRLGSRKVDDDLLIEVFLNGLDSAYQKARCEGLRMVLRDHAHSHFCFGRIDEARPSLRDMIARNFNVKSLVTVRHPIDSFLALRNNGWVHFQPGTLEEYCRRYHLFLDHYGNVEIFRYEDFIKDPETAMKAMASSIDLPYDEAFVDAFSVHHFSGDSGRQGNAIAMRPRRTLPEGLIGEMSKCESYKALCERLGYDPDGSSERGLR